MKDVNVLYSLKGKRVRVGSTKPDGTPHPQAGKTGVVQEVHLTVGPYPTVHILIDAEFLQVGTIAIVSIESLEAVL